MVTGAAGAIGGAIAARLAAHGARVAMWDADVDALKSSGTGSRHQGDVLPVECDVADAASVEAALDATCTGLGVPAKVVAAAGVIDIHEFLQLPSTQWQRTMAVNLGGAFLTVQRCARRMVNAALPGSMVCIASVAARGPRPDAADYAASKAGVISMVRSAAVALAPADITVNAVCPGVVDTAMTRRNAERRAELSGIEQQQAMDKLAQQIPLGRLQTSKDVADVTEFLLSKQASYITGQALNACGGLEFN